MILLQKRFASLCAAFVLTAVAISTASGGAQELRIAAASDLQFALNEMIPQFEKQTKTRTNVTYGSSGNFFAQIQNGAPFDVFLSADIAYPRKLEEVGLAEPGSLQQYAIGRIVIWMPPETKIELKNLGWNSLLEAAVQKIAIANPEHAPYGRAAIAALQKAGIYGRVKSKLVYGENISQAAQFVNSGNAQAGIIARSLALSPGMQGGRIWEIPAEMHPPIEQAAIVLKGARKQQAARSFLEFMKSESGRRILEKFGFSVPQSS
jgi:molybdate transport system substrate-binding protein